MERVRKVIDALLPTLDGDKVTPAMVRTMAEEEMGLEKDSLKKYKRQIHNMLVTFALKNNNNVPSKGKDRKRPLSSDADVSSSEAPAMSPVCSVIMSLDQDSLGMEKLKEMGRAAGIMVPQTFKLLKDASIEEQEDILREKLNEIGVVLEGKYPSKREIGKVKKRREMKQVMDGLDVHAILPPCSRRKRNSDGDRYPHSSTTISPLSSADESKRKAKIMESSDSEATF